MGIVLLSVGALAALVWMSGKAHAKADRPAWVKGSPSVFETTAASGNTYRTELYPPDAFDRVYAVAYSIAIPGAFVAYEQDRETGKRKLLQIEVPFDQPRRDDVYTMLRKDHAV